MIKYVYKKMSRIFPMDITRVLVWKFMRLESELENAKPDSTKQQYTSNLDFVLMQANDLRPWAKMPEYELDESVVNSIDSSSVECVAALQDGQLAGYMFFCKSPVAPQRNSGGSAFTGIGLEFPDNVRYLYKVLVIPEFRGKRIASSMLQFSKQYFCSQSIYYIVTTTDWTNSAFLQTTRSVGFNIVGSAAETIILRQHRYFLPREYVLDDTVNRNLRLVRPN